MNKYSYNEITILQFIFLINGMQVATGVLALPRVLAEKAGTDGWIAIIIGWLLSMAAGIFMVKTAQKYPNDTLYEILIRFFGKIVGKIAIIIYVIYFASYSCVIFVNGMLYIKAWLLPKTPDYIIILLFAIPTFMVARNGIRILGRFNELTFYMTLWIPLLFLVPLWENGSFLNVLPILKEGWKPVFSAVPTTIFAFLGFDIAFFLYPFLQKKQYAVHGIIAANTLTMLFYLFATLICYACFSPDEITEFNQPVLNLLKVIEFRFLERFDMILLAIYLLVVATAWIPCIYCTVFCSSKLLKKQDHSSHVIILLLLIIGTVFFVHPTWNQTENWQRIISNAGLKLTYFSSVFLWMYSFIYDKYIWRKRH